MLPKEVKNLFHAVNSSTETQIDVLKLQSELAGWAAFNRTVVDDKLLTPAQREVFQKHVGQYVFLDDSLGKSITGPAGGPPKVVLKITAPSAGVPKVQSGKASVLIECPNCHHNFTL